MSVSWMLLERYALGEVNEDEKRQVEAAIASDAKTRARYDEIRGIRRLVIPRWIAPALAAGVAITFFALRPTEWTGVKGDALTLSVVSEHGGTDLQVGERYQFRVTCVPPREASVRVEVTQDGKTEQPFGQSVRLQCANDVPLPDALMFDSTAPARVCVHEDGREACVVIRRGQ